MEAVRENVTVSAKVLAKNSKCYAESSVIVPDKNPDILKVLQVDASCALTNHTVQKGRIGVSGKVYVTVLYLPDSESGGIKSLLTDFDFDDVIDSNEIDEGMHVSLQSDIDQVDISLINSRKISLRAAVSINAEASCDKTIEYISALDEESAAYKCESEVLYAITAEDSCEFLMKEQVELPQGKPMIGEILKTDIQIEDKEVRAVTNKVIVKGSVCTSVLYAKDTGEVEHAEARLPFTEVFELGENCEDDIIDVRCSVMETNCKAERDNDGDMRVLAFEILIGADMCAKRSTEISYLSDCYFYAAKTEYERETISLQQVNTYPKSTQNVRESIACDKRMPHISSIYNVVAKPRVLGIDKDNENVKISARLEVSILYLSDNAENPVCCYKTDLPIEHNIQSMGGGEIAVSAECEHVSYSLNSAGDVELRAAVSFLAEERSEKKLEMLSDVRKGEAENCSQIIIFFAKGGEDLWDIGKRFCVSCDEIAELNKIEPDSKLEANTRLIIPCA